MTQIEKLEIVVKEWEDKADTIWQKSTFARDHNFIMEADMLYKQSQLIQQVCRAVRMKVIEELIEI